MFRRSHGRGFCRQRAEAVIASRRQDMEKNSIGRSAMPRASFVQLLISDGAAKHRNGCHRKLVERFCAAVYLRAGRWAVRICVAAVPRPGGRALGIRVTAFCFVPLVFSRSERDTIHLSVEVAVASGSRIVENNF